MHSELYRHNSTKGMILLSHPALVNCNIREQVAFPRMWVQVLHTHSLSFTNIQAPGSLLSWFLYSLISRFQDHQYPGKSRFTDVQVLCWLISRLLFPGCESRCYTHTPCLSRISTLMVVCTMHNVQCAMHCAMHMLCGDCLLLLCFTFLFVC